MVALTRAVSASIADCALSFIERRIIDPERAIDQHRAYEALLGSLGAQVVSLSAQPELPDAVFVEDTAVVVDEMAVVTQPFLESRRKEVETVAAALAAYRPLVRLNGDARLEGGDVLRLGKTFYVGRSRRTNRAGVEGLRAFLSPYGYTVREVAVDRCLHLKTACTALPRETVLANPDWVDTRHLEGWTVLAVPADEPEAGNALVVGETVVLPSIFPRTRELLEAHGFTVVTVDISELQKAEAGLTCCSILFESGAPGPQA